MLKIVNESLLNITAEDGDNDYGHFTKTILWSSPSVISKKVGNQETSSQKLRAILRVVSPTADYNSNRHYLASRVNDFGVVNLLLKADTRAKYDSNIIVIAFPFNGFIEPIAESRQYRVHKAMVVPSDGYSVDFDGKKYKKIFYMIIEPHMNLLAENHAHHVPSIDIELKSFVLKTINTNNYDCETMKVSITADKIDTIWSSEEIETDAVRSFTNTPLFTLYKRENTVTGDGERIVYSSKAAPTTIGDVTGLKKFNNDAPPSNNSGGRSGRYVKQEYDYDDSTRKKQGNRGKKSKKRSY